MTALLISAVDRLERNVLNRMNGQIHAKGSRPRGPKELCLVDLIVEAVEHKAHQIGNNCLRTFRLQGLHQVIVGGIGILDQNFSDNADSWLFQIFVNRNLIELTDHLAGDFLDPVKREALGVHQKFRAFLRPFLIHGFHGSLFQLVGTHPVDTFHQHISENGCKGKSGDERKGDFEAGISLETGQVRGDHRDLFHAGFFQSAPDEADVVGGTAAAARLGHDDCSAV